MAHRKGVALLNGRGTGAGVGIVSPSENMHRGIGITVRQNPGKRTGGGGGLIEPTGGGKPFCLLVRDKEGKMEN